MTRDGLLLTLLTALVLPSPVAAQTLRISNGDWPPFMGKELPGYGLVTRIVTDAFKAEGIDIEYQFLPWARAYYVVKTGQLDASVGWFKNDEREREVLFSEPVFVEKQVLFHLKSRPLDWKNLADLKGKSLGATLGYTYGEAFSQAEQGKLIQVQRTSSDELNLRKLLAGRIDAALISQAVGDALLKNQFSAEEAAQVTSHPRAINSGPLYVIFPKQKPESEARRSAFNRGLARLKLKQHPLPQP